MRFVTIIGDSVSTYEGYNPYGYRVFYEERMQRENELTSVYDTWWAKVNQSLHAYLCVNNSYSGSKVTGLEFPAATSDERLTNLHTAQYSPDIILIYIGYNDFGNGIRVSRKGLEGFDQSEKNMLVFEDAYEEMISKIQSRYPKTEIVCGTLMRTKLKYNEEWIFPETYAGMALEEYNDTIRKICEKKKCHLADLSSFNTRYETIDGSHPTREGHLTIADAWIKSLDRLGLIQPSIDTCIKMYHANPENDVCVYKVFKRLVDERVLMAFSNEHTLSALSYDGQECIPIFTSSDKIQNGEPVYLRPVLLRENIEFFISAQKSLIVNPFSEPQLQFIIPYPDITKMLKPVIQNK